MIVYCKVDECAHNENGECHYINPCGGMDYITIDYRDGFYAPPVCKDYYERNEE